LLVRHFIRKHSRFLDSSMELNGQNLAELCERDWPGNVRELESAIKRWVALRGHGVDWSNRNVAMEPPVITPAMSMEEKVSGVEGLGKQDSSNEPSPDEILRVLEECRWNRRKATELLGMSYQALRRRIIKHKLDKRF